MLIKEFETLTGIFPDAAMYAVIEQEYYRSNLNKAQFCADYKDNKDGIAERIQQAVNLLQAKEEDDQREAVKLLQVQLASQSIKAADLQTLLEKEEEWEPIPNSNMSGERYRTLRRFGRTLTTEEAVQKIADEFGFNPDTIHVKDCLDACEKNRHGKIRKTGIEKRPAVWDATDSNYIRFNVCPKGSVFHWEMVDGELLEAKD